MRRTILGISVMCVLAAAGIAQAKIRMSTLAERVAASDVIVVGKVTAVKGADGEAGLKTVEIAVTDVLKGEAAKTIVLTMKLNLHNTAPEADSTHVFFLKPKGEKEEGFVQAIDNSPNSITDAGEADKVKAAVAAEKAASKPAK
jgi:hypothetical protein